MSPIARRMQRFVMSGAMRQRKLNNTMGGRGYKEEEEDEEEDEKSTP